MTLSLTFCGLPALSVKAWVSAIMIYISSNLPSFCNSTLRLKEPT